MLDDELRKLPANYREVLVACDLEGRPRRSVAEGLGIPEGTLSSRLAAARKMLVGRLARRGLAPGVLAAVAAGARRAVRVRFPGYSWRLRFKWAAGSPVRCRRRLRPWPTERPER